MTGAATAALGRGEVAELERELEREMRQLLRVQNTKLQLQVQALTKGKGSSAGSTQVQERGGRDDPDPGVQLWAPPPPPRTPPASPRTMYTPLSPSAARYTLNGTQVPLGPPPVGAPDASEQKVAMAEVLGTVEFRCGCSQVGEWARRSFR